MPRSYAKSPQSTQARLLVEGLQHYFKDGLESLSAGLGHAQSFEQIHWLRDEGKHGGGDRFVIAETPVFNRAAINVSGVHYNEDPKRALFSADALSTIIHPAHPLAPSVHMHFSWTQMRHGHGYYRMMADLNPSIENPKATQQFEEALRSSAGQYFEQASEQGDKYFYIPALHRSRGVCHFYLEGFNTDDFETDTLMAERVAKAAMDSYLKILDHTLTGQREPTEEEKQAQLAYHTTYLFQVLTLDRGTTSGLLVHDQNDLGIMGSIPSSVDRQLLASWESKAYPLQKPLVRALVAVLEDSSPSQITDSVRYSLAKVVRKHYQDHPEALMLQASGGIIAPTVANHRK